MPPPMPPGGLGKPAAKVKNGLEARVEALLEAQKAYGDDANSSSAAESCITNLFDVEVPKKGKHDKEDGKGTKKQKPAGKQEYDSPALAQKKFALSVLIKGIDKDLAKLEIKEYSVFVERLFQGDKSVVGAEEPSELVGTIERIFDNIEPEVFEAVGDDAILNLPQAEFAKQFKGVSKTTAFIKAIADAWSKRPVDLVKCLAAKSWIRDSVEQIDAGQNESVTFYKTHATKIISLTSSITTPFVISMAEILEHVDDKTSAIRREYVSFERYIRQKATLNGLKDPMASGTAPTDARVTAVVPMLFVANLLNNPDFKLRSNMKHEERGAWSPTYLDIFLSVAESLNAPDKQGPNLRKALEKTCDDMLTVKAYKDEPLLLESYASKQEMLHSAKKQLHKCKRTTPAHFAQEWEAFETVVATSEQLLETLDEEERSAVGDLHAKFLPQNGAAGPDWEKLLKHRDKYAEDLLKPSGGGAQSTAKEALALAQLYDDYTLRKELHLFCSKVQERSVKKLTFHHAGEKH